MKLQLVGLGNVGRALIKLLREKEKSLKNLGASLTVVGVTDSNGTAADDRGLDLTSILAYKNLRWRGFNRYVAGYKSVDAIREIESDVVVELTPSTSSGEPGLSNILTALTAGKDVVTANKGPLVVAYKNLVKVAQKNHVSLLYEATVAAHLPVFCLIDSCFKVDELLSLQGILNATTNFIIGEMEKGREFRDALSYAVKEGWTETNSSDDIDGVDAARKVVILANSLFNKKTELEKVKVKGIRHLERLIKDASNSNRRVKLICEIAKKGTKLDLQVAPKLISSSDPLATVNGGDMGLKLMFRTSQQIFVSAHFCGIEQTAYAVLNDILKTIESDRTC